MNKPYSTMCISNNVSSEKLISVILQIPKYKTFTWAFICIARYKTNKKGKDKWATKINLHVMML